MSDDVTPISAGIKVNKYGQESRPAIPDFPLQVGDSEVVMVHEPDAGTVMDIEEAGTTRAVLQLFIGDDYAKVEDHINSTNPSELVDIAADLGRHFKLQNNQARLNRADRRRAARGR